MDEYAEISVKLQEVFDKTRHNEKRLDQHYELIKQLREDNKTLIRLTDSVDTIAHSLIDVDEKVNVISEKQDKINEKVAILENRPANEIKGKFDSLMDKLIWLAIGGAITILTQPFLQ